MCVPTFVQGIPLISVTSAGRSVAGSVDLDRLDASSPPAAVTARHGHVDLRPIGTDQLEQRAGRAVRQHRAWAAGKDRSHQATVTGQKLRRRERIDAVVDAVQPVGRDARATAGAGEPALHDLVEREDAMLRQRQYGERLVEGLRVAQASASGVRGEKRYHQ